MKRESGSAMVELALVMPVLLTLGAFAVEFGQLYWTQNVLQKAAQEGTRALSLASGSQFGQSLSGVENQMLQDIHDAGVLDVQSANISFTCLDSSFNAFASAYCLPGNTAPADGTLAYVETTISLPLPNLGSTLPFNFLTGSGLVTINAASGKSVSLTATALYPYGTP